MNKSFVNKMTLYTETRIAQSRRDFIKLLPGHSGLDTLDCGICSIQFEIELLYLTISLNNF
jgi:hypothetical protein